MKHIVYETENGEINRVTAAPGARLVNAIDGATFEPPWKLESALAALGHGRGWSEEKVAGLNIDYAETEDEFLDRIRQKDVPATVTKIAKVDPALLPHSKWQPAWTLNAGGGGVEVDMPKARNLHMARIRDARDRHPDWKQIDKDRAIATEGPDIAGLQDVKRRADVLRNLPAVAAPLIEAAATPEDLDAIWPEPLPPRD